MPYLPPPKPFPASAAAQPRFACPRFALLAAVAVTAAAALAPLAPAARAAEEKVEFPAPSPAAVVKQRVGVTDVELDYARPSKKGREVFGGLVPFGANWRTGANASTKISFSDAVRLEGKEVPAGKYALYTIPGEKEWTVVLSKDLTQFDAANYKPGGEVARFTVKPETLAAPVETFALAVEELKGDGATLTMTWDRTRVPVRLTVDAVNKVRAGIARATAPGATEPLPRGFHFQAAGFNLDHDGDLNQALGWINQAAEQNPKAYWVQARKGQIQAKLGDKAGAVATTEKAIELAKADAENGSPAAIEGLQKFIAGLR